jgi:hypothetical protein
MTDPPPLSTQDLATGERYAGAHDPGPAEEYAGEPVADPWEVVEPDGELDTGTEPSNAA